MRIIGAHWPAPPTAHSALVARFDSFATEAAARPWRALATTLCLDLVVAACFVAIGYYVIGDQAELFREYTPGTVLSFLQLLLIAAAARAVHLRTAPGEKLRTTFWGLCTAIFCVFAFDEITQSGTFIGGFLTHQLGIEPAGGFHDVEAVLLTLLFIGAGLLLLPRALALLKHPRALPLFAAAALIGALSQTLDSFAPATRWEFVAEETLKLSAEAFFLGAFLVVLSELGRGRPARRDTASE